MRVELVRGTEVQTKPVDWLWKGWLAAGKLHVLAGAPGTGKTTVALSFATTLTTGGSWPDETHAQTSNVAIWSGEDEAEDTLAPRLRAAGADMSRVYFVRRTLDGKGRRPFDPATDMVGLREALDGLDVKLLIIDSIVNAVSSDSNKNAEVRRALAPLIDLASTLSCAVFGISHYTKGSVGRDPVERVTGSIAFAALARLVFGAAKLRAGGRIFVRAKSNISEDGGGFVYDVRLVNVPDVGVEATCVQWGPPVAGSAHELLLDAEVSPADKDGRKGGLAEEFLRGLLASGEMTADEVRAHADMAGHKWRTVQQAATKLCVRRSKAGMLEGWLWSLPKAQDLPKAQEGAEATGLRLHASSADGEEYEEI